MVDFSRVCIVEQCTWSTSVECIVEQCALNYMVDFSRAEQCMTCGAMYVNLHGRVCIVEQCMFTWSTSRSVSCAAVSMFHSRLQ